MNTIKAIRNNRRVDFERIQQPLAMAILVLSKKDEELVSLKYLKASQFYRPTRADYRVAVQHLVDVGIARLSS